MEIQTTKKDHQRDQLQADMDKFLSAGGMIRQCAVGESAIVTPQRVAREIAQAKRKLEADVLARKERRAKEKATDYYELIGKTFGLLTVIKKTTYNCGNKAWVCKCACGRTTRPIATTKLIRGDRVDCGCTKKKK